MKWYLKAAEQGDAKAQYILGLVYDLGEGVPLNYGEAMNWARKAAEQGLANAQYFLGNVYSIEESPHYDTVKAHMWFNLAASNGVEEAVSSRDALAKTMTPAQVQEAQELARNWKPKK